MSGIYIPGERIPDTLTAFWIFPNGYVRVFGKNGDEIRGREAIPVPDHGRLIDKDVMCKECRRVAEEYDGIYPDCTYCPANLAPTIIPEDKEGE